jgi:hypothetical protein
MKFNPLKNNKFMMDLEKLNTYNEEGCAACGNKFSLGDVVVVACGGWEGGPKLVHEREAVFEKLTGSYIERKCYDGRKVG